MAEKPKTPAERAKEETILELARNRVLAHQSLFKHRHGNETPVFHREIIELWHGPDPLVLIKAFRGAAKSSLAEEAIIIQACLREFNNAVILGETYDRAVERLRAIKHELEQNEFIEFLFGKMPGATWAEEKIILSNGLIIQAFGRGQSLRGSKHLASRPDRAFFDDIESKESVSTAEAIDKTMDWVMAVVIPALEPGAKIRVNGTPLHPRSVIEQLSGQPDWVSRTYPIERIGDDGERKPLWPDRFPQKFINDKKSSYERLGMSTNFAQEYMCKAEDPAAKPFTSEMMKVEPTVRTWQPVYAMCDPARTARATSAMTGVAVWSWIANRLIVWDAFGGLWKPDEIVDQIFQVDEKYRPVVMGVERDGLEEFILQPLRHEQLRRGYAVPIRDMKAPRGKIDFITSLQPFFKSGEVIFAKECPDARGQFLSFPTGRIDIPNALAYALMLRPGQPIYDNFGALNVVEELPVVGRAPAFLAVNSDGRCTTGALAQTIDGGLRVLADWCREGDAGSNLGVIVQEAGLRAHTEKLRIYAPKHHFNQWDNIGLRAAAKAIPAQIGRGGSELAGREEIRALLARLTRSRPALLVSSDARWTLNAMSGGFCKEVLRTGVLTQDPAPGPYRVLMEGLESFAALMKAPTLTDDLPPNYAFTTSGRRYLTSRPSHG